MGEAGDLRFFFSPLWLSGSIPGGSYRVPAVWGWGWGWGFRFECLPCPFFPPLPSHISRAPSRGSRLGLGFARPGWGSGFESPSPISEPEPRARALGLGLGLGFRLCETRTRAPVLHALARRSPPPVHASRLLQQRLPIQSSFFFVCVRFTSPCRPFARLPGHSRTPDTACVSEKQRARAQLAVRDLELRPLLPSTTTRCARLPPLPAPSAAPRSAFSVHPWAASHTRAHPRPLGTSVQTRTSHQWANQNTGRFFLREKVRLCRISSESVLRSS